MSQITLYPQEMRQEAWTGRGAAEWTVLTPEQHPQQSNIIAFPRGASNKKGICPP
ncbi:hypothetical protein MASR1M66_05880 [Aminivibrio sp.]